MAGFIGGERWWRGMATAPCACVRPCSLTAEKREKGVLGQGEREWAGWAASVGPGKVIWAGRKRWEIGRAHV